MRSKIEFQHHRDRVDRIPRAPLRAPVGSIDVPRATFRALGGSINAPYATFRTLLDSMEVSGAIFGDFTGSVDVLEHFDQVCQACLA